MKKLPVLIIIAIVICSGSAYAQELSNLVEFHGYGSWGYGQTDHNTYLLGNKDGDYNNFQFSLAASATPIQNLKINAQATWLENSSENTAEMAYAFAEWSFSDLLQVRLGKVKQPFGIYTEVYDIGTVRPFFSLPQSIYGPAGFVTEGYKGMGLTGSYYTDTGWGLDYDLYGGKLDMELSLPFHIIGILSAMQSAAAAGGGASGPPAGVTGASGASGPPAGVTGTSGASGPPPGVTGTSGTGQTMSLSYLQLVSHVRDVVGARITAQSPYNLSLGASFYTGLFDSPGGMPPRKDEYVYGAHGEYNYRFLTVRGEYLHFELTKDFIANCAYLEADVKFLEHWQLAGRYDWSDQEINWPGINVSTAPSLVQHEEWTAGLNYWFNSNFVIKTSYHLVEGNRFAVPDDLNVLLTGGKVEDTTHLFVAGAQFSF